MTFYTRKTLAAVCGLTVRSIDRHTVAGTSRLDRARQVIPGVGVRYDAQLASRFVAVMTANKLTSTHVAV